MSREVIRDRIPQKDKTRVSREHFLSDRTTGVVFTPGRLEEQNENHARRSENGGG